MILVGRYLSPFVRRVAVTLRLYGLEYEHRPLMAFGDDKKTISQWNPVGRVPVLILDDGESLFESGAILDYLDERVGPDRSLTPASGRPRREVLRLLALATGAAEKTVLTLYEVRFRPEEKRHEPWVAMCSDQVRRGFEALDAAAAMPWMTGETMGQADVIAACCWSFAKHAKPELTETIRAPRLDAIAARAESMPEFQQTVPNP
ncbi:MAG: glutathione S-transferase family protein [Gammaproteobacteria bacterium]|nr:glutathione S-transferase family protein [Gammaproteobacteria bacterium]MDH3414126.1 glutathione S-transferase family protein [Gammaproteobacteria bacterium]